VGTLREGYPLARVPTARGRLLSSTRASVRDHTLQTTGGAALAFLALAFSAMGALVLLAALWLAITLPIHAIDALSYGEWSRLIAEDWRIRFPGISAQTYHRPLFYVLQGSLWNVFGFHEWIGRVLALSFTVLLFFSTAWLVARGCQRWIKAALAIVLLCLIPDVLEGVASGLTDVPVAAAVAFAAALAWWRRPGIARPALLGLASGLAVLAKPTALVALVALVLALIAWPRATRRLALVHDVLPILAGCALALVYDLIQARYLGMGLLDFLRAGSTGFYEQLARDSRFDQLVGVQWLGSDLRPLLVFALVYAALRVCAQAHQQAVLVALVATPVLSLVLPTLADEPGIESSVRSLGSGVGFAAICLSLVGALWCSTDEEPPAEWLGRLLVLGLLPAAVWLMYGAYETRLGSAAWPGLVALMAVSVTPALLGLARRAPLALVVPGATLLALVAYAYTDLDGLGEAQWREYQTLGLSEMFADEPTRNIVQPQISQRVRLAAAEMGPDDRLVSAEGQFRFYFPGRVDQTYPASCAELRDYRVFVLLTDEGTRAYMRDVAKVPDDPAYWAACTSPKLTALSDPNESYLLFRVER
jgi:hypothetical protein